MRRLDGSVAFDRNWSEYVTGFGSAESEYWLSKHKHLLYRSHRSLLLQDAKNIKLVCFAHVVLMRSHTSIMHMTNK